MFSTLLAVQERQTQRAEAERRFHSAQIRKAERDREVALLPRYEGPTNVPRVSRKKED